MSVAIPQVRMEIFRGPPKFFDDNFLKTAWTTEVSSYTVEDGDIADIDIITGQTYNAIYRLIGSFSPAMYKYLIARCTAFSGVAWALYLRRTSDQAWIQASPSYSDAGLKIVDISTQAQSDGIRIAVTNAPGHYVKIDYVAICKDTLLVPVDETKSDVVESLTITRPLLHRGVGGFSCKLPNINAEYTGKISDFDHVLIYLWRKGSAMKKVFGGKILLPGTEGSGTSQEYYLLLNGMDVGQEMLVPPNLMRKLYAGVNGRTIIEEAVDLCGEVTKDYVDVDDEIASTHDFEFEEVKPHSVIAEVCAQAKTLGGVVGFDGYVDPAGNLRVFKRGKYTSSISLAGKIEHYKKEDDVHRVRNKIKVYGVREKAYPADKDAWTESIAPADGTWGSGTGVGQISFDTTKKIVGTGSIKLNVPLADYGGIAVFTLNSGKEASCYYDNELAELIFQITMDDAYSGNVDVELRDDADQELYKAEKASKKSDWNLITIACGRKNADQWTIRLSNTQPFNWKKVKKIIISCDFPGTGTGAFWIDGLYFYKKRFEGTAEDTTSQSKYGVRWEEPVVDDSLKSDNECLKKAESLRDFLKDKVTTLSDFRVEGENGFTPGDRQLVTISNDNINDYFRILEIRDVVSGVQWDTYLMLSNEPQMVDYVFADLHRELRRLSLSKGKSNPGGGCAGERYMAATKVVAPSGYAIKKYDYETIQEAINAVTQ